MKNLFQKLALLSMTGLLLGGGLFLLLSSAGCGSTHTENVSERPWSEPRGFQYQGTGRRKQ
jgi:hypothetical protein